MSLFVFLFVFSILVNYYFQVFFKLNVILFGAKMTQKQKTVTVQCSHLGLSGYAWRGTSFTTFLKGNLFGYEFAFKGLMLMKNNRSSAG